jgi:hypothetical protein
MPGHNVLTSGVNLFDIPRIEPQEVAVPRQSHEGEEKNMFVMTAVVFTVVGLWIVGAVIGAIFKLVFGIIGGIFTLIGGLIGVVFGGLALLIVGPLVLLAMLPVFAPVLLLALIVWLIVRANRPQVVSTPAPATR